MFFLFIFT